VIERDGLMCGQGRVAVAGQGRAGQGAIRICGQKAPFKYNSDWRSQRYLVTAGAGRREIVSGPADCNEHGFQLRNWSIHQNPVPCHRA